MNRRTKTSLWTGIGLLFCLLHAGAIHGQTPAVNSTADTAVVTFRFVPEQDMFYIPWAGNGVQLERLYALLGEYRSEITAGRMPVYVDGYCASLPSADENLRMAFVRANRVKSELITRKGLKEADFITSNYARAYDGSRDVVVVTLRIPATITADDTATPGDTVPPGDTVIPTDTVIPGLTRNLHPQGTGPEMLHSVQQDSKGDTVSSDATTPARLCHSGLDPESPATRRPPYRFALRTNLLYDALLLPTLGLEWRINRDFGVRIDGSLAHWGGATGKVQKVWLLNPEVRRYLLAGRRFYVGVSATYGEYNLYKYPLGGFLKDDTGYQGHLWGAALTTGYQLALCRCLALDFNLGLGYARSEYDSFTMTDDVRVYKQRDRKKNLWGPTQAGINLVWTIGGKQ